MSIESPNTSLSQNNSQDEAAKEVHLVARELKFAMDLLEEADALGEWRSSVGQYVDGISASGEPLIEIKRNRIITSELESFIYYLQEQVDEYMSSEAEIKAAGRLIHDLRQFQENPGQHIEDLKHIFLGYRLP